ncbi:MAG TPA: sn-glycerol-1-phosphate dehydrogenase [Chloroflexota bacterium]|nr:sn-glycerol-1-phosphate dehydrogenase [Chloroflexota bacterium]
MSDVEVTRVVVRRGALDALGECVAACGGHAAQVVADETTYEIAGRAAESALRRAGLSTNPALVLPARPHGVRLHADYEWALQVRDRLREHDAVPVAAGAGTVNDLTKLGAHLAGRPYVTVATAASMDGYAAFGAAITRDGFKHTAECAAPRAVLADPDVLAAAPRAMTASGFGDLMGKVTAGADWLVADALEIEPIDRAAWDLVQPAVRETIAAPERVRQGDPEAIARLFECLAASGLAMQRTSSSRPASGAEHQLSHLWEMRGLRRAGEEPSHGFKVGVGSVLIARLYERVLARDWGALSDGEIEVLCRAWAPLAAQEEQLRRLHVDAQVCDRALVELRAKYVSADALRGRLRRLRERWEALRPKLDAQLLVAMDVADRLRAAGCPAAPVEIGLTDEEADASLAAARQIRRRYTVLDLAAETGQLNAHAALAA